MLYRITGNYQERTIDLRDLYSGTVFLCGGHPCLNDISIDQLRRPGIVTMAMNNAATIIRPNLWICADKVGCYDKSIIQDPGILKFVRHVFRDDIIKDKQRWRHMPGTVFYEASDKIKTENYLSNIKKFVWWRNVFMIAVQMSYYLGFRKIYLCGAKFRIDKSNQYCYPSKLSDYQVQYNNRTYNMLLAQFKQCLPILKDAGVEVISCTAESAINTHIPYIPISDAIDATLEHYPIANTKSVKHSSEYRKGK